MKKVLFAVLCLLAVCGCSKEDESLRYDKKDLELIKYLNGKTFITKQGGYYYQYYRIDFEFVDKPYKHYCKYHNSDEIYTIYVCGKMETCWSYSQSSNLWALDSSRYYLLGIDKSAESSLKLLLYEFPKYSYMEELADGTIHYYYGFGGDGEIHVDYNNMQDKSEMYIKILDNNSIRIDGVEYYSE